MFGPTCEQCLQDIDENQEKIKDEEGNLFCNKKCKKAFQDYYDELRNCADDPEEPEDFGGIL